MEKSLYFDVINTLASRLLLQVLEEKKGDPDYSYLDRLGEEYSLDGTFQVLSGSKRTIKADLVAMDSSIPLKSRPTLGMAYGKVPKIGQSRKMGESELKRADVMASKFGRDSNRLRDLILNDSVSNVDGILDTMQELYLKGLCNGVVNVGADNVGLTEIRLDYGFIPAQKRGVPVVWTNTATSTPVTDIIDIVDRARANGTRLTEMHLNATQFSQILKSDELKSYFDGVVLTENRARDFFRDELGLGIQIVTRTVNAEIDGVITNTQVWTNGIVTFTQSGELGTVFYTDTAEHNHRSECAVYAEPNDYILSSMFRTVNPLTEQSIAQAMALPVITDVDNIWQLNVLTVQA